MTPAWPRARQLRQKDGGQKDKAFFCVTIFLSPIFLCDGVNNRIVKLSMDGQVIGTLSGYGKAPGKLDFVHNIAVDSTGALYVAEIKNWRVQKFAA